MARKPMGMPSGVELRNGAIRIRFTWNGERCSETLPYSATKEGIASASRLRDQVVSLNKLGLLSNDKYAGLFPTFGEYAQTWLDSREIVGGTRRNYKANLNKWWMPVLAVTPLASLTPVLMRKHLGQIAWTSNTVKFRSMVQLSTILSSAVSDGLLDKNPLDGLDLPKTVKKEVSPFTKDEAEKILVALYKTKVKALCQRGAFFEFAFFSGMRLSEIMALRWEEIDFKKKTAFVCRIVAEAQVQERTKTSNTRTVLLNERALHALAIAKDYVQKRKEQEGGEFPYCFPPSSGGSFITNTSSLHKGWKGMLTELKLPYRPPYNARHTYATICLMSDMNTAFIAQQMGHSVQMLLSTYAKWLNTDNDWKQMEKLNIGTDLPQEDK